jgi:hypothetical protein
VPLPIRRPEAQNGRIVPPTVPAYCLHCMRPVTLTFEPQAYAPDNPTTTWKCPYDDCAGENEVARMNIVKTEVRVISPERQAQDRKQRNAD